MTEYASDLSDFKDLLRAVADLKRQRAAGTTCSYSGKIHKPAAGSGLMYAQETGGRLFEVSKKDAVEKIYAEIEEELRNQYSIAYTPDKSAGAGYHKIELALKQKDLSVQARDGFPDQAIARYSTHSRSGSCE